MRRDEHPVPNGDERMGKVNDLPTYINVIATTFAPLPLRKAGVDR